MSQINNWIDKVVKPIEGAKDNGSGLPYATHEGTLELEGYSIKCYVLSNGQRIFDSEDIEKYLSAIK